MVNWQRLSSYGNNGNAVLIDAYLQGVKQRAGKKGWKFRDWIAEETLIDIIDPHGKLERKEALRQIREAFELMYANGVPKYEYNKIYKRWEREEYASSEF